MVQHNLKTVVGFEFTRTVKKRRFWLATLAIPFAFAIVARLIYLSNVTTSANADAQKSARFSFSYSDASGLITEDVATPLGGSSRPTPAALSRRSSPGAPRRTSGSPQIRRRNP
jgi:ABC-2 type transport system permease protein